MNPPISGAMNKRRKSCRACYYVTDPYLVRPRFSVAYVAASGGGIRDSIIVRLLKAWST